MSQYNPDLERKLGLFRYIPFKTLLKLNRKAVKAGKNSLSDSGLVAVAESNKSVIIVSVNNFVAGIDWLRCTLNLGYKDNKPVLVFLDISQRDFEKLPIDRLPFSQLEDETTPDESS